MEPGCYTALVTPFKEDSLDKDGIKKLIDFQISSGVSGVVSTGTTGESPAISRDEYNEVVRTIAVLAKNKCDLIVGAGSNNTSEAIKYAKYAAAIGASAVLLVDPYYNRPSSMEIRREYIEPVAESVADIDIIPYVVPNRTGTQLFPEDIAMLSDIYSNVSAVKEATGNFNNMRKIRRYCRDNFSIFSGDDFMTFDMMSDPEVDADGVISAISNVIPEAICKLTTLLNMNNTDEAKILDDIIKPLFSILTVETVETTYYGNVVCKARNPLPLKTLMSILGMPSGGCRRPLGKMSKNGFDIVLNTANMIQANSPELFRPISDFFNVDIDKRLVEARNMSHLFYSSY